MTAVARWYRGTGAKDRAFDAGLKEELAHVVAAEWILPGIMQQPVRVFAAVNRGWLSKLAQYVTSTSYEERRLAHRKSLEERFPPKADEGVEDGDVARLPAHLHYVLGPDSARTIVLDIDAPDHLEEYLLKKGFHKMTQILKEHFELTFPDYKTLSGCAIHLSANQELKKSYRLVVAPLAPPFATIRDASSFLQSTRTALRRASKRSLDESWLASQLLLMDRCIGMSKWHESSSANRELLLEPDARFSCPSVAAHQRAKPVDYLLRCWQCSASSERLRCGAAAGKRARAHAVEASDEGAACAIAAAVHRATGREVSLGARAPTALPCYGSHSLFCPFRECKRDADGLLSAARANAAPHTKNPLKVKFGLVREGEDVFVFCFCFSCRGSVGKGMGRPQHRVCKLAEEELAMIQPNPPGVSHQEAHLEAVP